MNILEKIQKVKEELLAANLKKSGENKYAGFKYYELADFLPTLIKLCNSNKLFTKITFDKENAKLIIKNIEKNDEVEEYESPIEDLELKGCNKIQALGGTQTYLRRYLYMNAFDITENDMFDSVNGKETKSNSKELESVEKQLEEKKATEAQINVIKKRYTGENLDKLLKANGVEKVEDLSLVKASEIIKKLAEHDKKKKEEN